MQNRALKIIADRAADVGNEKAFNIAANALDKLEKTKAKYPVDRAKGVSTKYDKLLDAAAKK